MYMFQTWIFPPVFGTAIPRSQYTSITQAVMKSVRSRKASLAGARRACAFLDEGV